MISSAITIPYSIAAAAQGDLLVIEQEEWSKNIGVVTKFELLRYISSRVYDRPYISSTACGVSEGSLSCLVNVYPRRGGIVYRLHTSWGAVSEARGGLVDVEEIINFTLSTEEKVKYPCRSVKEVYWLAECYSSDGAEVDGPEITVSGDSLTVSSPVYGSAQIKYQTEKYTYTLTIPKREAALEEFFSAVIYALYVGGIVWEEIKLPDNFDENTAAERCGLSGSGTVTWPDEDPRSIADNPYRRHTIVDYCSQTIVSDTIV